MTTFSGNDWGSHSESKYSSASPQTTDEFEFNQRGKPMKAIIGLAVLVAFAVALAFFKPASDNMAKAPSLQQDKGSAITQMNREPGRTTGQAPASPAN